MNCTYNDSPLTWNGTERKRIYIPCSNGLSKEAKLQALKDFNAQRTPIAPTEIIKPFVRKNNFKGRDTNYSRCAIAKGNDPQTREIVLERQEWADAAFYYMRYIL